MPKRQWRRPVAAPLIKDLPADVHEWLEREAKVNRRSMTQQAAILFAARMRRFRPVHFVPPLKTRTPRTSIFTGEAKKGGTAMVVVDSYDANFIAPAGGKRHLRACLAACGNTADQRARLPERGRHAPAVRRRDPALPSDQSMWKTSFSGSDLGLLSGLDGMISFMCAHHFLQIFVFAMAFHRSSSSISA